MPNIVNGLGQVKVGVRTQASVGVSYLLDTYSGAAAAYSLRKLRTDYTGSAIRVRRSNDNTTLDVGFDASGNLDTTSLLNFVGYRNYFLSGSETLESNSSFSKVGLSVTENWLIGPDGVTPGNKLQETATNGGHYTGYSIITGTAGAININNYSAYLKKGTGSAAPDRIAIGFGNTTYHVYGTFNLSTGVIETQFSTGTVTDVEILMTDEGNGWYRCSVGGNLGITASGTQGIAIRHLFVNNSASYNPFTGLAYLGNVNADVQITQVQWVRGLTTRQRYSKTLTSGGGIGGNGFVSIWYDQSSTYDASQAASASQPQIVSAGSVITKNGKPTVKFDGVDDFLVTGNYPFVGTDKIYVAYVATALTNTGMVVGHYKTSSPSIYMLGYRNTGRSLVQLRNSTNTTSYVYTFNLFGAGGQYLYERQFDLLNATSTSKIVGWRNGVSDPMNTNGLTTTALPTFTQPLSIGAEVDGASNRLNGDIQEIIAYYNVDQTSNRTGISSNINTYYTIY